MECPPSKGLQSVAGPQMLEAILNTAVGAIITIGERGIIQNVNPATEVLFGYAASEVIGNNIKYAHARAASRKARRLVTLSHHHRREEYYRHRPRCRKPLHHMQTEPPP